VSQLEEKRNSAEIPQLGEKRQWREFLSLGNIPKRTVRKFLRHVNLLYSEKPSDIYQVVADKTVAKLEAIVESNTTVAEMVQEDDKTPEHKLAQWWLNFGITRKVTKRNCMTFPYGVNQNAPVAK